MSHYLPCFFFPVEPSELSDDTGTVEWTEQYLTEHQDHLAEKSIRLTTSRNSAHQTQLYVLCDALGVSGLEFVLDHVSCLRGERLETARAALDRVTEALASGRIPTVTRKIAHPATTAWLASLPTLTDVFRDAPVSFDARSEVDVGVDAERAFFSFVKSLRHAVLEALGQSHCLMWFSPAQDLA